MGAVAKRIARREKKVENALTVKQAKDAAARLKRARKSLEISKAKIQLEKKVLKAAKVKKTKAAANAEEAEAKVIPAGIRKAAAEVSGDELVAAAKALLPKKEPKLTNKKPDENEPDEEDAAMKGLSTAEQVKVAKAVVEKETANWTKAKRESALASVEKQISSADTARIVAELMPKIKSP